MTNKSSSGPTNRAKPLLLLSVGLLSVGLLSKLVADEDDAEAAWQSVVVGVCGVSIGITRFLCRLHRICNVLQDMQAPQ